MRALTLPILFMILILSPQHVRGQCSYFEIVQSDPYSTTTCGDSMWADPTDVPTMPTSGTKQLTATFVFKLTDLCNFPPPFTFYHLNVNTVGTTFKKIFEIKTNSLTSFTSYVTDTVGTHQLLTISTDVVDTWVIGAVSIDLTANKLVQTWMTATDYSSTTLTNLNFGTWTFKPNSATPYLFAWPRDLTATTAVYAQGFSQKFTFGYTFEENLFPFIFGIVAPIRLGLYSMLENTGWKLNDAASFGAAYFGSSTASNYDATYAPSWSASGVVFTNRTQYIKMPGTTMFKSTNPLVTASASLTFMIRLDEIFTGTVFTRVSTTSVVVAALNINSYGKLQAVLSDTVLSTSQTALPLNQWVQVTVFYMFSQGRAASSIHFDTTLVTPGLDTAPLVPVSSLTETNTDIFKIGGFKGSIRNLAIYGPASPRIVASKCLSCSFDMGATTAACIRPSCTSIQYISGQTCQACDGSCLTCVNTGANGCLTCPGGKILSASNSCETPPATSSSSTPTSTPTTPTSTSSDTANVIVTNPGPTVEAGTGFDGDVIASIIIAVLAMSVFVGIVVSIVKKKSKEKSEHKAVPSYLPQEGDIKEESLY